MDCSLPGSSVHGIFEPIVLEWIAISFSSGSSQPRDQTWVSCVVGRRFTVLATREVLPVSLVPKIMPSTCVIEQRIDCQPGRQLPENTHVGRMGISGFGTLSTILPLLG